MGRPKGSKNKAITTVATGSGSEPVAAHPGVVTGDPLDRKLDHFQYATDEHSADIWEHGEGVNPLTVPKAIREKYPHLRFRWCSENKWNRLGKNYDGWQKFTDPQLAPDGERRGRESFLAVMPEERAKKRDRYVQEKSTAVIKGVQERNLDQIEQVQHGESMGVSPLDTEVKGIEIGRRAQTAISFGGKVRKGGGYHRGYSPEELQEVIAKNREKLARGRKYFT